MKVYIEEHYLTKKGKLKKNRSLAFIAETPDKFEPSWEWTVRKVKLVNAKKKTPLFTKIRIAIRAFRSA